MAEKVKIHPGIGAAALGAAECAAVELPCGIEIVYVKGEMEKALHGGLSGCCRRRAATHRQRAANRVSCHPAHWKL